MATPRLSWGRTRWPGIYVCGDQYRIRVRAIDPRSGRLREVDRVVRSISLDAAVEQREALRRELDARLSELPRSRIVDFGRYWLGLKKRVIDPGTYDRYEAALEEHAFKAFGRMEFIDLRGLHVQNWINEELEHEYRISTVKGWFRAFRTMVQDATEDLALSRDPTRRIHFPPADEREEKNALLPEQLVQFLAEMERRYPQHYPLTATLALTGLRFCHASALRWEDFDEEKESYYDGRPHRGLHLQPPAGGNWLAPARPLPTTSVRGIAILGGLHHRYGVAPDDARLAG
jgi:integrase